jgi:hypothetical protein
VVLVVDGGITSEQKNGWPFSKDKQKKIIANFTNMIVVSSAVSGLVLEIASDPNSFFPLICF